MTAQELLRSYYTGLNNKDDSWQQNLADNATFADGTGSLNAQGKQAFIAVFTTFLKAVDHLRVKQMIVEDSDACAVITYEYVSPTGDHMTEDVAEVWRIENEQLTSLTIYFNFARYRQFMGR